MMVESVTAEGTFIYSHTSASANTSGGGQSSASVSTRTNSDHASSAIYVRTDVNGVTTEFSTSTNASELSVQVHSDNSGAQVRVTDNYETAESETLKKLQTDLYHLINLLLQLSGLNRDI